MIPLGPSFAKEVLNGGSAAFGVLMTALGFGAAFGVVTLLWLQNRLPAHDGVHVRGDRCRRVPRARGLVLDARARRADDRRRRRVRRWFVRHRLHRLAGDDERRAARPHVRDALHRHPAVPADLVDDLAALGGLLERDHQGDPRADASRCRSGRTPTRCPVSGSRCGAAGSSPWPPGSRPGGRSGGGSAPAAWTRRRSPRPRSRRRGRRRGSSRPSRSTRPPRSRRTASPRDRRSGHRRPVTDVPVTEVPTTEASERSDP